MCSRVKNQRCLFFKVFVQFGFLVGQRVGDGRETEDRLEDKRKKRGWSDKRERRMKGYGREKGGWSKETREDGGIRERGGGGI